MALKAVNLLRAEGDVGDWITPDTAGMHPVGVRVTGAFDGALVFETKGVSQAVDDAVAVGALVAQAITDLTAVLTALGAD